MLQVDHDAGPCYTLSHKRIFVSRNKALTMPLNARQIDAVKSLLRRAAELVADAQNVAAAASEPRLVASLKQLRLNVADEIADLVQGVPK
jgi:hypothetical protein